MIAFTKAVQTQSIERECRHKVPPLNEELFAIDSCWGGQPVLRRLLPLEDQSSLADGHTLKNIWAIQTELCV